MRFKAPMTIFMSLLQLILHDRNTSHRHFHLNGIGFLCKHHPAGRCYLRFGSKRTENFPKRTEKFEITRGAAECDFKFSVCFEKFPCALKAKSQITPLRRVMFAINTTTTSRRVCFNPKKTQSAQWSWC